MKSATKLLLVFRAKYVQHQNANTDVFRILRKPLAINLPLSLSLDEKDHCPVSFNSSWCGQEKVGERDGYLSMERLNGNGLPSIPLPIHQSFGGKAKYRKEVFKKQVVQ